MANETSKLDYIALLVGGAALLVSIASPFIVYNCLQNDVRIQSLKANAVHAIGSLKMTTETSPNAPKTPWDLKRHNLYSIRLENEGTLPVNGVELVITFSGTSAPFFDDCEVHADPARTVSTTKSNDAILISFAEPFPPREKVDVEITTTKKETVSNDSPAESNELIRAWLRTEASPTSLIPMSLIQSKLSKPSPN